MYHAQFTRPDRRTMRLITDSPGYSKAYIDGLMYMHDLICEMGDRPEPSHYTPEEIHENMAGLLKPDIYISYSSRDRLDKAIFLADDLRSNNVNIWIALPGTGLPKNWDAPLKYSSHFVSMASPQALDSEWIRHEWEQSSAFEKPFWIVLTESSDIELLSGEARERWSNRILYLSNLQNLLVEIRSGKSTLNENLLPFKIVENLRLNYDAVRRIWFLGDLERFGEFHPESVRSAIANGTLDVENMAVHFIDGLIRTYIELLHLKPETER